MPGWTTIKFTVEQRLEAFFSKIIVCESGCHEFIGAKNEEGYGNFWDEGICKKAHRFAWECFFGKIPEGKLVLHTCDNPPCCNPDHLYLGSNADNTRDKMERGRHASTAGENNPAASITYEKVLDVHAHLRYTYMTQQAIADKFGLTKGHVNNIKAGRAWSQVQLEITDASYID